MLHHFIENGKKKWISLILIFGFAGGGLAGATGFFIWNSYLPVMFSFLFGWFVTSSIFFVLAIIDKHFSFLKRETHRHLNSVETELKASVGITPLSQFPVKTDPWHKGYTATAHFLEIVIQTIVERRPNIILECGSGSSTVIIGSCLRSLPYDARLISLEHDPDYAIASRSQIKAEGLEEWVDLVAAPLRTWNINGKEWKWYDFDPQQELSKTIDMVVVDGPPGYIQPMSRYPAIPILKEFLSDPYMIILDDGNRDTITEISRQWVSILGASSTFNPEGRGILKIYPD